MTPDLVLAAVESLGDRFVILTPQYDKSGNPIDFLLEYANPSALTASGLEAQSALKQPLSRILPFYGASGFRELYEDVLRTGQPAARDGLLYRTPSGPLVSGRFLDVRVNLCAPHLVVTWREATKRCLDEERFKLAQEAGGFGTFDLDLKTGRAEVSIEWEALYGLPPRSFDGRHESWLKCVHPDDREWIQKRFEEDIQKERSTVEFRIVRPDGEIRWIAARNTTYKDGMGFPSRMVGITTDITVYKTIEASLRASAAEMERFAFVASHDLKEPMRAIANYARLLHSAYHDRLDLKAGQYLDYMVRAVQRMNELIDALLAYAKVGELKYEAIDSNELLGETLGNLRTAIQESQATVVCPNLPVLRGDRTQLARVFQNLLSNALKFRGEKKPRIELRAERLGEQWHFVVADNGIGIPSDELSRIFEIFHRVPQHKEYKGTGIGLSICKKIVEAHCGRLWVESTLGEGSRFHFSLPAV